MALEFDQIWSLYGGGGGDSRSGLYDFAASAAMALVHHSTLRPFPSGSHPIWIDMCWCASRVSVIAWEKVVVVGTCSFVLRMKLNEALSRNGWVGREVLDGSDDM